MRLPRLDEARCESLTACGRIKTASKEFVDHLRKAETMASRCRVGSKPAFLRVLVGRESTRHLHIDCALDSYFPRQYKPEVNHTMAEIMSLLNGAIGATVDVGVVGYFVVSLDEVPERGLVRSLYTEQKSGGLTVEIHGWDSLNHGSASRNY